MSFASQPAIFSYFKLWQTEPFGGRLLGFARTWWQYLVDVSQGTAAQYHSSHSIYYGLSVYNSCQERNLNASLRCKGYIFVGVTVSNSCQKSVCCHIFLICASTIVLPRRKGISHSLRQDRRRSDHKIWALSPSRSHTMYLTQTLNLISIIILLSKFCLNLLYFSLHLFCWSQLISYLNLKCWIMSSLFAGQHIFSWRAIHLSRFLYVSFPEEGLLFNRKVPLEYLNWHIPKYRHWMHNILRYYFCNKNVLESHLS